MATLKRTESRPLKETQPPPPPRECVVCCEEDSDCLVKPCRTCDTDYCAGCLLTMFEDAITDRTRMPPRCCTFLQTHTVISDLCTDELANDYREKFEEWISPAKTYCPAPRCSAFIPERLMPQLSGSKSHSPSRLPPFLEGILLKVQESPSARFFRGEMDITQLPGYNTVVERPIDLSKISANVPRYDSVNSLTQDMQLLASNAVSYNGPGHPVSKAAEELYKHYLRALSLATQGLLDAPATVVKDNSTFPCPKCHIAICTSCKLVEHGATPCDSTSSDQELAMLQSFGYKRCPRCKAGVKKMYGCSHMQCVCGAHWCYWCQRSIDECDGACGERDEEDDEEEYDSEDDLEREEEAAEAAPAEGDEPQRSSAAPAAATGNPDAPANLDGGGARRWADPVYDFGEEPEEESPHMQVWSCKHKFSHYRVLKEDTFDRGDYLNMECNRCFSKVVPRRPLMSARTSRARINGSSESSSYGKWMRALEKGEEVSSGVAWECHWCKMVTCEDCKKRCEVAKADD